MVIRGVFQKTRRNSKIRYQSHLLTLSVECQKNRCFNVHQSFQLYQFCHFASFVQGVYYDYKTIAGLFGEGHFCCFRVNITKYFAQSIEFAKVKIHHHQKPKQFIRIPQLRNLLLLSLSWGWGLTGFLVSYFPCLVFVWEKETVLSHCSKKIDDHYTL